MSNTVSVCIPQPLREKAGEYRLNISAVCRKALADEVSKIEKNTPATSGKTDGGSTSQGGQVDVIR